MLVTSETIIETRIVLVYGGDCPLKRFYGWKARRLFSADCVIATKQGNHTRGPHARRDRGQAGLSGAGLMGSMCVPSRGSVVHFDILQKQTDGRIRIISSLALPVTGFKRFRIVVCEEAG